MLKTLNTGCRTCSHLMSLWSLSRDRAVIPAVPFILTRRGNRRGGHGMLVGPSICTRRRLRWRRVNLKPDCRRVEPNLLSLRLNCLVRFVGPRLCTVTRGSDVVRAKVKTVDTAMQTHIPLRGVSAVVTVDPGFGIHHHRRRLSSWWRRRPRGQRIERLNARKTNVLRRVRAVRRHGRWRTGLELTRCNHVAEVTACRGVESTAVGMPCTSSPSLVSGRRS